MIKNVLIVGHKSGITSTRINGHLAEVRECGVEVIEVEKEHTDISMCFPQPIDFEFIPKQKHVKKGYESPYKFHR